MLTWGWRIPFLASFLLLAVGLYFRLRIAESPVFLARRDEPRPAGLPLTTLLHSHPGTLLKAIAFQVGPYCGQGVFGIFIISYAPTIGYARGTALNAILIATALSAITTPLYAGLSDRCWEFAVLAFATARVGVVLVPVNFMLNADEIAYILSHSGAKGIVAEDALA